MKTVRVLRNPTLDDEIDLTAIGSRSTQERGISHLSSRLRVEKQRQDTPELPVAGRGPTGWSNSGQSAADHDSHRTALRGVLEMEQAF